MPVKKIICDGLTDNEVVSRSLKDLDYFSCLYDRYGPRLLLYIKKISSANQEEAEDILQDAFIKIWRNLNEYDHSLKLSSWLYRIVHNETISYCRKKRSFGKDNTLILEEDNMADLHADLDWETDPEYKYENICRLLHKALSKDVIVYRSLQTQKWLKGRR